MNRGEALHDRVRAVGLSVLMKCEFCQSNEAVVHFKQVIDGDARELHLCEECAAKKGIDLQPPLALTDFLFGAAAEESDERTDGATCPECGLTLKAFRKDQRLGCSQCYEAFAEELSTVLPTMHGSDKHVGKAPAGQRLSAEIDGVRKAMEKAVVREDFEEAARLRDTLKDMQAGRTARKPHERKVKG
jgi:protein arginine kinase activator